MIRFITRRKVLLTLAGGAGGLVLAGTGSFVACNRSVSAQKQVSTERLLAVLPEVFAPERLAKHWLERGDAQTLTQDLLARPELVDALNIECVASRRAAVRSQFAQDFANDDVVVVDRLLVARSECLIASLCFRMA